MFRTGETPVPPEMMGIIYQNGKKIGVRIAVRSAMRRVSGMPIFVKSRKR